MSFKSKFLVIVMSASLAMYAIAGAWLATRAQQPLNDPNAQQKIFESVLSHIQNDYVDEPNMEKVRAGALRGLAYGLDPYSTYLTAEQVKDYRAATKTSQVGIGAELSQASSFLYVVAPVKGSPADQAGLRAGDVIEYIDGKATPNTVSNENKPADCTITVSLDNFKKMVSRELDGTTAFMQGKLKVAGDMSVAMKLGPILAKAAG